MNWRTFLPVILLAFSSETNAQGLNYWLDVFKYQALDGQSYVEVHTHIQASDLFYQKSAEGKFYASAQLVLFLQNGNKAQTDAIKVTIQSPVFDDTAGIIQKLVLSDVRKIQVNPGKITVLGTIADVYNPASAVNEFEKEIWIESGQNFSDIIFIENFTKTGIAEEFYSRFGYEVTPRLEGNFFRSEVPFKFYTELYATDDLVKSEYYFVNAWISKSDETLKLPDLSKTVKKKAGKMDFFNSDFDISLLPSGEYFLHIDLYSEKNQQLASKSVLFAVQNEEFTEYVPYSVEYFDKLFGLTEPEIDYYFHPMTYLASAAEQDTIAKINGFEEKKAFFYEFWDQRKNRPTDNPAKPFGIFSARVDFVNKNYKSVYLEGWKTDRGRVFLTYGPPNNVEPYPAQSSGTPYEIWLYNRLGTQANVQFVFVDWDLATGDYDLAHSTKRGEINNPAWRFQTYR